MNKNVLILYYSQTGQLTEIIEKFSTGLRDSGELNVEIMRIEPSKPYSFPWTSKSFFATMPPSVLEQSIDLKKFETGQKSYDLIVLGYQPWFLSPSIPTNSLLREEKLKPLFENTPVITIIGARNMWINAQEKVKEQLTRLDANLKGNIALVDKNPNLLSAVSVVHWLIGGKKTRYLGIFPKPGLAAEDINKCEGLGRITGRSLVDNNLDELQKKLVDKGAVEINDAIMFVESRAKKIFDVWANFIDNRKNKTLWLKVYKYYLFIALFVLSPIVLLIYTILLKPATIKARAKRVNYLKGLETD